MHLHKKGILAQASAQEKRAERVSRCLHGLYNETGAKLKGTSRRARQYSSTGRKLWKLY